MSKEGELGTLRQNRLRTEKKAYAFYRSFCSYRRSSSQGDDRLTSERRYIYG